MKLSQLKLVPMAAAMVLLGAAGSANAGAYALSANYIRGFDIATTGTVVFGTSRDTSSALAILNTVPVATGGVGVSNAPIAIATGSTFPVAPTDNSAFPAGLATLPVGPTNTNYSYADAQILHTAGPGLPFDARTIAESHLQTAGSASGTSTNSSATAFTATFDVVAPGSTLEFSFEADPLIRTFLQNAGGFFAQGTLSASLTITCASTSCGGVGLEVFTWAPNGVDGDEDGVGGSVGGDEIDDEENLNVSVSNFNPPGGALNFSNAAVFSNFSAVTGSLLTGSYTLSLAMTSTDATLKVPEPGTIALLGLGLTGLGFASRRRRSKA